MNHKPNNKSALRVVDFKILGAILLLFGLIGLSTFLSAFITIRLGKYLDNRLGTAPWLMIALGLIGMLITIGITFVISMWTSRKIQTILNEKKEKEVEIDRDC